MMDKGVGKNKYTNILFRKGVMGGCKIVLMLDEIPGYFDHGFLQSLSLELKGKIGCKKGLVVIAVTGTAGVSASVQSLSSKSDKAVKIRMMSITETLMQKTLFRYHVSNCIDEEDFVHRKMLPSYHPLPMLMSNHRCADFTGVKAILEYHRRLSVDGCFSSFGTHRTHRVVLGTVHKID